jgi:predicted RNA-binding Zn-ribbon protein involved in translation (DUF1610 family)
MTHADVEQRFELPDDHPLARAFRVIVGAQALPPNEFEAVVSAELMRERFVNWVKSAARPSVKWDWFHYVCPNCGPVETARCGQCDDFLDTVERGADE